MKKIVFVCHGNICRSPLAEFLFKHIVKEVHREDDFLSISRATSFEEIGNDLYPPIKRLLDNYKIPYTRHYATRLKEDDYGKYDLFLCMDYNNMRNIKYIFKDDKDHKIHMLGEFIGDNKEVEDPWYTRDFIGVYNQLNLYLKELIKII